VVSGNATTGGDFDDVVSCLPVVITITEGADGEPATISLTVPESVANSLVGTSMYVAVGTADGTPCESEVMDAAVSAYNVSTRTVTATVCGAGNYVATVMQPSLVQRAIRDGTPYVPPQENDDESSEDSGSSGRSSDLTPGSIAGIAVSGVVLVVAMVVGAYWMVQRSIHRERQRAVALGRSDSRRPPGGFGASASIVPDASVRSGRSGRMSTERLTVGRGDMPV
jgi:hypothetical protein